MPVESPRARMRILRRCAALIAVGLAALSLTACGGTPVPNSVVQGSVADVAWPGSLTTLNAATASGVVPGDRDVAALTRSQFARAADGVVTPDTSFGTVEILSDDDRFTVRYDLAEPTWSDGIAVDAADLMLAWAAGSALGAASDDKQNFGAAATGLAHSNDVPAFDEFARRIDVTFERPVIDWQTALNVAVPAHVAGRIAFGIDDPMAAKQAVITTIVSGDTDDLSRLTDVWRDAFDLSDGSGLDPATALSSGPYRVESVEGSAEAGDQLVTLVANSEYAGSVPANYHRVAFRQAEGSEAIDALGSDYDVVQIPVADADYTQIRDLQRDDYGMSTASTGRSWTLFTRVDSWPFYERAARSAFLRTIPRGEVVSAASGEWAEAYAATSVALFSPSSDGYQIALEDAGFDTAFAPPDDARKLREKAGVPDNAAVCILYDTDSSFARKAFATIRDTAAEAGWLVRDCGDAAPQDVIDANGAYDAVLTSVDVPRTPAEIARRWGDGPANVTRATSDERAQLIDELSRTTDEYDARDALVAIEKTIVDQAVALPLAVDPVVLVSSRNITPVQATDAHDGALVADPLAWAPAGGPAF